MNSNREQDKKDQSQTSQSANEPQKEPHSSAFRETSRGDEKSTTNIEGETDLEQERKEAMTERD